MSGSQTAFLTRIMTEVGLVFVKPLTAAKMILGDAVFSKFISSKAGQKWLTEGYERGVKAGQGMINQSFTAGKIGRGTFQAERVREAN